jgi:type II secretory pathway predicted ATPase ExeA
MAVLLEQAVWVAVQMEAIAIHNQLVQLLTEVVEEVVVVGFQALVMVALEALASLSSATQTHSKMLYQLLTAQKHRLQVGLFTPFFLQAQ